VKEVELTVAGRGGRVPTVLWLPDGPTRPPVVLLAHGGRGHKQVDRHERLAQELGRSGIATLAVDGPYHGERRPTGDGPLDYQQRVATEGAGAVHVRMRDDWLLALDTAAESELVDDRRVGVLGMSMGARYGLVTCAALGPRLRAAVLGKLGLTSPPELRALAADDLVRAAAPAVTAPVLWHVQADDEVFPEAGQLALFDRLGSADKTLRVRPGGHSVTRPDDEKAWCAFLSARLTVTAPA
jgi:dienelactone hydrolase